MISQDIFFESRYYSTEKINKDYLSIIRSEFFECIKSRYFVGYILAHGLNPCFVAFCRQWLCRISCLPELSLKFKHRNPIFSPFFEEQKRFHFTAIKAAWRSVVLLKIVITTC